MNEILTAVVGIVGTTVTVGGGLLGIQATSRNSRSAAIETAVIAAKAELEKNAATGYQLLVDDLRTDLDRLKADGDENRQEIRLLKESNKVISRRLWRLESKLADALGYIKVLWAVLAHHSIDVPVPPVSLELAPHALTESSRNPE